MDIGWFRDLIICIWGLVAAPVLVFVAILLHRLYKKTGVVLDSLEKAAQQSKQILTSVESSASVVHSMVSTVNQEVSTVNRELYQPVMQLIAIVQGVRCGIDTFGKFFIGNKGGRNGK